MQFLVYQFYLNKAYKINKLFPKREIPPMLLVNILEHFFLKLFTTFYLEENTFLHRDSWDAHLLWKVGLLLAEHLQSAGALLYHTTASPKSHEEKNYL